MVVARAAALVALASWGVRAVAAPPVEAAALVHEEGAVRLGVGALDGGAVRVIGPPEVQRKAPLWSPDGRRLAYFAGGALRLSGALGPCPKGRVGCEDSLLLDNVDTLSAVPAAFSPDSRAVAAAVVGGVALLRPGAGAPAVTRVSLGADCRVGDLSWRPDGKAVIALCQSLIKNGRPRLETVSLDGSKLAAQPVDGLNRLLGWRPTGELVVARARPGGEEACALSPSGTLSPLRPPAENQFVVQYLGARDLLILVEGSEDPLDPVKLSWAAPGSGPAHPWLRRHRRANGLAFTGDGAWVLFLDGGSVWLAPTGGDDARLVLKATKDRLYSAPVPRPPAVAPAK